MPCAPWKAHIKNPARSSHQLVRNAGQVDILQSIILGLLQGLTEFLPISSSAHLILLPKLLGWTNQGLLYDVGAHLGSLLALLIYFRKDLARDVCRDG